MRNILLLSLLACFCFAACEDLEDTYDDFVGDGPIDYLATCSEVTVSPGWERLVVTWKNHLDPFRSGVWVQCVSNTDTLQMEVAANDTICEFRGLSDATYVVSVAPVSETGDTALVATGTGRPYTLAHESVMGYGRGIQKYMFVKNNLVMFMGTRPSGATQLILEYTDPAGNPQELSLINNFSSANKNILLEDVDASSPVRLHRKGLLGDCVDTITFPVVDLDPELVNMDVDFQNRLLERYGTIDYATETLELDYDLPTIEDILYFPNLTKLELGKNRYYDAYEYTSTTSAITGGDDYEARAEFAVETMKKINPDFEMDNYGGMQYRLVSFDFSFSNWMDIPSAADKALLDVIGDTVMCSVPEAVYGFRSSILLDDDPANYWETTSSEQRTYELTLDLGEMRTVNGLKITQPQVGEMSTSRNYFPTSVIVEVSMDNFTWESPCHALSNTLGTGIAEVKLLDFVEPQEVRYIRLTLRDRAYNGIYGCNLGDFIPY